MKEYTCFYCGDKNEKTLSIVIDEHIHNHEDTILVVNSDSSTDGIYASKIQSSVCAGCRKTKKTEHLKSKVSTFLLLIVAMPVAAILLAFSTITGIFSGMILLVYPVYYLYRNLTYGTHDLFAYDVIKTKGPAPLSLYPKFSILESNLFDDFRFQNIGKLRFKKIDEP